MIYRAYRIVQGYTSERIRKDISDFNKKYPYSFIFDNFFDTYESIEVKGFETAEDVLRFESTVGFQGWENFDHPVVIKRTVDNSDEIVYVFYHTSADKYAYMDIMGSSNVTFKFHEFVENHPDIPLISYQQYLQKCAEAAPTSDQFLSDVELVNEVNKSLNEFDAELESYNVTYDVTDKETQYLKLKNENSIISSHDYIVVLEDGRIVTGPSCARRLNGDRAIYDAKKWTTFEDNHISHYMYANFQGQKYQVYPIITTTQFKLP